MALNIWISGVGGPTPRSIARSLRLAEADLGPLHLVGTDCNPLASGLYEHDLYDETLVIPRADDPEYVPFITEAIAARGIDIALVHPELEVLVWSALQRDGKPWPCAALIPDHRVVEVLTDKGRMNALLADTPWIPTSLEIDPEAVADAPKATWNTLEKSLGLPFWVRSATGSSGLGALKIDAMDTLTRWLRMNDGVTRFVGSTFLPGRNLAVKLLYVDGSLVRAACGERVHYIMAKTAPSGITGNTSFGRLLNAPELIDRADALMQRLFERLGVTPHGFFTADFKEDAAGVPLCTEVNVRMVAFNYSFAQAGANFSADIVRYLNGGASALSGPTRYAFEEGTCFVRDVDTEPRLMNERDLRSPATVRTTTVDG